ncbi:MAG: hypothetical protein MR717_02995 [Prevotella sp.]|nr:hypothetical protein [Prevotella sp.]
MGNQSISELLATAKLHLLTVAQELEKNGIDLYKVKFERDDDEHVNRCLLTWGKDIEAKI